MRIQSPPGFGGDVDDLTAFPAQLGQESFALTVAIHVGGVKEIDAHVHGSV